MSRDFQQQLQLAAKHLADNDAQLAPVIARVGLPTFEPHTNYYWELIDSIISQQLSVKAAASIEKRFQELFEVEFPEPQAILDKSEEELRTAGLSGAKARYIRDLAENILTGKINFTDIESRSNEQIIEELTAVKGIGEWTAHMFLIFSMGRLDVLATGDLGVRNGIRTLYGFKDAPTPDAVREIAKKHAWHPYESVACWYVWQSLDNAPG